MPEKLVTHAPGELSHRIEILFPSDVSDGGGGKIRDYVSSSPRPTRYWAARVRDARMDQVRNGSYGESGKVTLDIHYRSNVTADVRTRYDGRIWKVTSASDPDDRRRWLRLVLESL